MLTSTYNPTLVVASMIVAMLASYTALDMAGRVTTAQGRATYWWLGAGAFAMGLGIWSMHFVGMLAFSLPIPLGYDLGITLLSLLFAIGSSAFALWLVCQEKLPWRRLGMGAVLMGCGIASMHYTGMAAMLMNPGISYVPSLFILSVIIAITAAGAALWIAFSLRNNAPRARLYRAGAAVIMGLAIVGMHYTGMAAAEFPLGSICGAALTGVNTDWLAILVIVVTLAVLSIALVTSLLDLRLESRTSVLATSLAEANQELVQLALHDHLTKLPNRVLLEDRLDQAMQKAAREQSGFFLMYIDLDGFKTINDAFGHQVGDALLMEVASRIRGIVRAQDTVARVGGDEFVLLGEGGAPDAIADIAANLTLSLSQPFAIAGHDLRVSASVGIAIYPEDGTDHHHLLKNADAAMYHAKELGRNRYCFFKFSMNANALEQLQLLQDLRMAVERDELILHYQPKFDAPNGPISGAEALLRWRHPVQGEIAPDRFIHMAERSGLIVMIGEWVLDEACRQMKAWRDLGHDWSIAVNLSALQFSHAGLFQTVSDTLARHSLEPGCLTLEITESTTMHNVDASMLILQKLHELGVKISIDDFGTGYSSLLYLKRLPASELKIDRGFIRELAHDSDDAAIVAAIVALGQKLNLKVVAEGVETAAQQSFLTGLGCDSLQGFLLGHPVPADQFLVAAAAKSVALGPGTVAG